MTISYNNSIVRVSSVILLYDCAKVTAGTEMCLRIFYFISNLRDGAQAYSCV